MMYKCCECGHLFEEGEQAVTYETHGFYQPPYEEIHSCPVCGGDFEEVHQCKECGDWHYEDELYDGWCEKCLRETINYDTFFEYCEANKDFRYIEIFIMQYTLEMDCPDDISTGFHNLMVDTYKRSVAVANMFPKTESFVDKCVQFIMDDDGEIGRENYADWLNKKAGK